jgi:hypothetical protein
MSSHGKHRKPRLGVHKNFASPETLAWNREHLIPKRPTWMDEATFRALARLRTELEELAA